MSRLRDGDAGDDPAPDFAMLRAVEILAGLAATSRTAPIVPPPPIDRPVILFNERRALQLGVTTRLEIARDLGRGAPFPAAGWWTYALRFAGTRRLLSVIFREDRLTGVELYVPQTAQIPALPVHFWGDFRLVPGEVALGSTLRALDARYTPAAGGPGHVMYGQVFEVRFPGGLGYVMGNAGLVERLVLYAAS